MPGLVLRPGGCRRRGVLPGVAPPGGGRWPGGAGAGSAGRECPPPTGAGTRGCGRLRQVTPRRTIKRQTENRVDFWVCFFFLVVFLKPFRKTVRRAGRRGPCRALRLKPVPPILTFPARFNTSLPLAEYFARISG